MSAIRRDNLDKLFSQWVRARSGWHCECCNSADGQLDCAHIVGRRNRQTRWDDQNAICLCRNCHQYFTDHPHDWYEWTIANLGADRILAVRERAKSTDKVTDADKKAITNYLIERLEWIGENPVWKGGKRKKSVRKKNSSTNRVQKPRQSKWKRKVDGTVTLR